MKFGSLFCGQYGATKRHFGSLFFGHDGATKWHFGSSFCGHVMEQLSGPEYTSLNAGHSSAGPKCFVHRCWRGDQGMGPGGARHACRRQAPHSHPPSAWVSNLASLLLREPSLVHAACSWLA
eukprot:scaffold75760_cov21-Tisochrysis_lutea.AAC.2